MKLNEITKDNFARAIKYPRSHFFMTKVEEIKKLLAPLGVDLDLNKVSLVTNANKEAIGVKFRIGIEPGANVETVAEKLIHADTIIQSAFKEHVETDVYRIGTYHRAYEVWWTGDEAK